MGNSKILPNFIAFLHGCSKGKIELGTFKKHTFSRRLRPRVPPLMYANLSESHFAQRTLLRLTLTSRTSWLLQENIRKPRSTRCPPIKKKWKNWYYLFQILRIKKWKLLLFFSEIFRKMDTALIFSEMLRWGFILRILCFVFASFLPRKIEKVPKIPQKISPRFARAFIFSKISQKIATGLILFKFSFSKNGYCSYFFQNIPQKSRTGFEEGGGLFTRGW